MAGENEKKKAITGKSEALLRQLIEDAQVFEEFDLTLAHLPTNDLGNGDRLVRRFGNQLKYISDRSIGWLGWDGKRWSQAAGERMARKFAHETAVAMKRELAALRDEGLRVDAKTGEELETPAQFNERLQGFAKAVSNAGNKGRLDGMLATAQPYLTRDREDLDRHPYLLTVLNHTLEFREDPARPEAEEIEERGKRYRVVARGHSPDDMITMLAPVIYDPKAQCPRWRKFLERIMPDREKRQFLQRFLGYCLIGDSDEHIVLLLYGTGRNGKGTVVKVARSLMGDYGAEIPVSALLEQRNKGGGEAMPELARLPGKRLVTSSEPEEGARLSTQRIKQMAGGDSMPVRDLFGKIFEFEAQFKLMISFNARPVVPAQDEGMWERLTLLGFEQFIPRGERVKGLGKALFEQEGSGILNWMIEGWRDYRTQGLAVPDSVRADTQEYRETDDQVSKFMAAVCSRVADKPDGTPDGEVGVTELWKAYLRWTHHEEVKPMGRRRFDEKVLGLKIKKRKSNTMFYVGVEIVRAALDALSPRRSAGDMDLVGGA